MVDLVGCGLLKYELQDICTTIDFLLVLHSHSRGVCYTTLYGEELTKTFTGYAGKIMDDRLQELLTITMEECGELIQACSKAIRCDDYRDNKKLIQEIADVYCMIELIHEYDLVSWDEIDKGVLRKIERLKKWSKLYD